MANEKKSVEKLVAVKARSLAPTGFWRCGKLWAHLGSVHMLEPTDLARLRAETAVVVVATGASEAAINDAESKAANVDGRLLAAARDRSERKSKRSRVVKYDRAEAVEKHIEEIEDDIDEDGVTEAEMAELTLEHDKLVEILKGLKVPSEPEKK